MLKKFGMVTVGVTAGLLAVAPLASASEGHHEDHKGHHKSHDSHGEHKSHHGHGKKSHGSQSCDSTGGDAEARGGIDGDALAGNAVTQAPIGGASVGSILSCNSDFLNGNLSGNEISVLGSTV